MKTPLQICNMLKTCNRNFMRSYERKQKIENTYKNYVDDFGTLNDKAAYWVKCAQTRMTEAENAFEAILAANIDNEAFIALASSEGLLDGYTDDDIKELRAEQNPNH